MSAGAAPRAAGRAGLSIWMVHPRLDRRGGAEHVIRTLSRGLAARGHTLGVATLRFDPGVWEPGDWEGVEVALLEAAGDRLRTRRGRIRARGRRLARRAARADLVVAHNFPAALWTARLPGRHGRPRRVWYCHEPSERLHGAAVFPTLAQAARAGPDAYPWADGAFVRHARELAARRPRATALDRRLDRAVVPRLDAVLANGATSAAAVARIYDVVAVACPPGVPDPRAVAAPTPTAAAPYVAWPTGPHPLKNAAGFLEALRRAMSGDDAPRDLRVRALGLDDALRRRVRELGLGDVVCAEAPRDDAGAARLLAGARLVAVPSLDEPFGLVPVEAMAHGRAVLASSRGGPAESVEDGATGVLVDPLDPGAVARALVSLWRDPARCDALGRAGRVRYERHYTAERFLDRFEAAALPGAGAGAAAAPAR